MEEIVQNLQRQSYLGPVHCNLKNLLLLFPSFYIHASIHFLGTKAVQTYKGALPTVTLWAIWTLRAPIQFRRKIIKGSFQFSTQLCTAASQIHMARRIRLNKSLSFNANRQKVQIHTLKLFGLQLQETDVFDGTRLERWQTDAVTDEDTQIERLSISTRLLSDWGVVNLSISIHHTTSLSAVGDIIPFFEIGLNPKVTVLPLISHIWRDLPTQHRHTLW